MGPPEREAHGTGSVSGGDLLAGGFEHRTHIRALTPSSPAANLRSEEILLCISCNDSHTAGLGLPARARVLTLTPGDAHVRQEPRPPLSSPDRKALSQTWLVRPQAWEGCVPEGESFAFSQGQSNGCESVPGREPEQLCEGRRAHAPTLTLTVHWGRAGQARKTCRCRRRPGEVTKREQSAQEKAPLSLGSTQGRQGQNTSG